MRKSLLFIMLFIACITLTSFLAYNSGRENPAPIKVEVVASPDGKHVALLDHSTNMIKVLFLIPGRKASLNFGSTPITEKLTQVKHLVSLMTLPDKDGYPQVLVRLEGQDGAVVNLTEVGKESTIRVIYQDY